MFTQRAPYPSQEELDASRGMMPSPEATPVPTPDDPATMGMVPRDPYIAPKPGEGAEATDKVDLFKADNARPSEDARVPEIVQRRHATLMSCLEEEGQRQAEERHQAQIDDDYYHHQQWTPEEARVLQDRGQAPLVFNESRGAIDWLTGTERRLRKDYKIRPRERNDEQGAELKTKVFKYLEDVNLAPWHRSRAFKQMVTSGLGWLEESLHLDPEKELIYSGSEDWRRIFRDSRAREFDLSDCRYLIRRKIVDLDYAVALLPKMARHLAAIAGRWGTEDEEHDDVWYLGQKLTSAHHAQWADGNDGIFGEDYTVRRSGSAWDYGRRNSVELLETWYRVPEVVKVFADGPAFRKIVNPADPRHQQLVNDRWACYETVKMRMRCMVGTKYQAGHDGPSPFSHGQFSLIPMWGYRRGRDGLVYGSMRGMRDPQDDLNKRRSKALFALSAQRTFFKDGSVEDPEELRSEVARVDALIKVEGDINNVRVEESMKMDQVRGNLELAQANIEHIRNIGGVTGESLGHDTNAQSGKAIIAKQEQGSLVTYELFDSYFLAFKLAGQIRLSNIEQFCNQEWTLRIDPQGARPAEWVTVNKLDPRTGQYLNDITAAQADFIVDAQDYRATLTQAALQQMFELLGSMAQFAPQVVLSLLDLVVDAADVQNKEEWVARIRKLNGQRDPSKPPTPEEMAADQANAAKQQRMEEITIETAQAELDVLKSKVTDTNAAKVLKNVQGLLAAIEAAVQVTGMPGAAEPADLIARSAGFVDETPATPLIGSPALPAQPAPMAMPQAGQPMNPEGPALSAPAI
jgi:hypothetical protein